MIEPDARILVCLMNHLRDLEIARWDHWYRIPVSHAPPEFLAEYLAFYLSARFGDEKYAIHEYAAVRGHELQRRVDLFPEQPDHPRAQTLYYKIQLGPLQRLPRPIPALRWRRMAFLQTSGDRFIHALEIGELRQQAGRRYMTLMEGAE